MQVSKPPSLGQIWPTTWSPTFSAMKEDWLGFAAETQKKHGDFVHFRGRYDSYFIFHPDDIRSVLIDHHDDFIRWERVTQTLGRVHGQSVLVSEGARWKTQRRILQPGFAIKHLDAYSNLVTSAAQEAFAQLPRDQAFAISPAIFAMTMDVMLRTIFSETTGAETQKIEQAMQTLSQYAQRQMFNLVLMPEWFPFKGQSEYRKSVKFLDSYIRQHIQTRHQNLNQNKPSQDVLAMMMAARDEENPEVGLSDENIRDQCMSLFLAGHDTTASALCWVAWLLAAHPRVTLAAQKEIDDLLGQRLPTYQTLTKLDSVIRIIKEALRLYSPAPGVFTRQSLRELTIGKYTIPKGALVNILSTVPHRDPRWFADPDRFDPDRFLPERQREIPRGAYFPFGLGPRTCIGNNFAMMEIAMITVMLLQRFNLEVPAGQKTPRMEFNITLHPEKSLALILRSR